MWKGNRQAIVNEDAGPLLRQLREKITDLEAQLADAKEQLRVTTQHEQGARAVSASNYDECEKLRAQLAERDALLKEAALLLRRYRSETPLGHQPHMIAHIADDFLSSLKADHENS